MLTKLRNKTGPRNFPDKMIERAREVARQLPRDEALSYLGGAAYLISQSLKLADNKTIPILGEAGKISPAWLPILALHIRGIYLEQGERALLNVLPYWIYLEPEFFLAEKWLRELFGQWIRSGEEGKLKRAFFGTPKRGTRSFQKIVQDHQRNIKIAAKISTLRAEGYAYSAAVEEVQASLKELGVEDHLSREAIRSIYKKIRAGYNPIIKLFQS
jgi:hypothetical protein